VAWRPASLSHGARAEPRRGGRQEALARAPAIGQRTRPACQPDQGVVWCGAGKCSAAPQPRGMPRVLIHGGHNRRSLRWRPSSADRGLVNEAFGYRSRCAPAGYKVMQDRFCRIGSAALMERLAPWHQLRAQPQTSEPLWGEPAAPIVPRVLGCQGAAKHKLR
jgi:hypothetical protein